jgi:Calx-beta domain
VPIINDSADEVSGTVNLALSQPTNANLGTPSEAVLTIADNDVAGKVQLSAAAYSVSEKGSTATVTVTRTMGAAGDVTVPYTTANGTALAGTNYTGTSGVLTFDQGETAKTFTVDVLDDGVVTGNKTVLLKLGAPGGGAALGTRASAVLWIVDGGPPP